MDKAHKKTDLIIEEIEKKYDKFYRKKQAEIKRTVDTYFAKFERQDKKWRADVEKGVRTEAQYKAWRKSHLARGQAYKDMQAKVADELYNVNQTATQYVNDRLAEVYSINYNAVEGAANSLKGYSFNLVNEDVVRSLADNDSSFLPFKELNKDVDVAWNMRNINNQVMQGIKGGDSIPDIAKRILGVEEMNKNASIRTARTIVTSAENKARQDSYEQMEKDGVIMKKRWIATRDARTRDWHAELDGQMVDVKKDFHNGIGRIAYPGDPTADAANVYNCRCTLATKITGFKKAKATETAKAEETPSWQDIPKDEKQSVSFINELLMQETSSPSVFNGNVLIDNQIRFNGTANKDGSITLRSNASTKTKIHELLHHRSIGGNNSMSVYLYKNIEEGSVEYFAREICYKNGISVGKFDTSYSTYVDAIKGIKTYSKYSTDYDFAKALFETPLDQRAEFLKDVLSGASKDDQRIIKSYLKILGVK